MRLYNLKFFCEQLPILTEKIRDIVTTVIKMRDARYTYIIKALHEADIEGTVALVSGTTTSSSSSDRSSATMYCC